MSTGTPKPTSKSKPSTEAEPKADVETKPEPESRLSRMREKARAKAAAAFWDPKPGESICGVLINVKTDQGSYGSTHWFIRQRDRSVVIVSKSPKSVLAKKLAGEHLDIGDYVYIEFLGERTSQKTGEAYGDWAVDVEHSERFALVPSNGKQQPPLDDDIPY